MASTVPNSEATRFTSGERAAEMGRRGGIASQKASKSRKARAKIVDDILSNGLNEKQRRQIEAALGKVEDEDANVFTLMVAGMVKSALSGNVRAFETLTNLADRAKVTDDGTDEDELTKSLKEIARKL